MSATSPTVTVIVPVWNSMPYVIANVEGVLAQSFTDFELLIIDDKGPDDSIAHLQKYTSDPRVRIIDNGTNRGFSGAMNHGLELARGEFIAALDADDAALPHRLAAQVAFLRAHPGVCLVGSAALHITPEGKVTAPHRQPLSDVAIRFQQLFMPGFYHPSTMLRRSVLEQYGLHYNPNLPLADDFDFWCRIGTHASLANLPEPLVYYRVHPNSLSKLKKEECTARKLTVTEASLRELDLSEEQLARAKRAIGMMTGGESAATAADVHELWLALSDTLTAFCVAEKLTVSPLILKATVGKWMIKSILALPSPALKARELLLFLLRRPLYALAGAAHVGELLLWQARWARRYRNATV